MGQVSTETRRARSEEFEDTFERVQEDTDMKTRIDGYNECCGDCGMGLCYVDHLTGEANEGWGWQNR